MIFIIRFKTFDATGLAPNGVLFAGDLNAIQDSAAALSDFTQVHDVGILRIGEAGLQLLHYASLETRLTGSFRADGIVRGLHGFVAGTYTTAERDGLLAGARPYGLEILNTTTNQYEFNAGTDAAPVWRPLGVDPQGIISFQGASSKIVFTNQNAGNILLTSRRSGDAVDRFTLSESGTESWSGGTLAADVVMSRSAASVLSINPGNLNVQGAVTVDVGNTLARLHFGSSQDAGIWRTGAAALRTNSSFRADGVITLGNGLAASDGTSTLIDAGSATVWHRAIGNAGFFNTTYNVGIYATAVGTVRTYNNSNFLVEGGTLTLGGSGAIAGTIVTANAGVLTITNGIYASDVNKPSYFQGNIFARTAVWNDGGTLLLAGSNGLVSTLSGHALLDYGGSGEQMRVHRHPYGGARHVESGSITTSDPGFFATVGTAVFVNPFASNAFRVAVTPFAANVSPQWIGVSSRSTGAFSMQGFTTNGTYSFDYIVEGPDT